MTYRVRKITFTPRKKNKFEGAKIYNNKKRLRRRRRTFSQTDNFSSMFPQQIDPITTTITWMRGWGWRRNVVHPNSEGNPSVSIPRGVCAQFVPSGLLTRSAICARAIRMWTQFKHVNLCHPLIICIYKCLHTYIQCTYIYVYLHFRTKLANLNWLRWNFAQVPNRQFKHPPLDDNGVSVAFLINQQNIIYSCGIVLIRYFLHKRFDVYQLMRPVICLHVTMYELFNKINCKKGLTWTIVFIKNTKLKMLKFYTQVRLYMQWMCRWVIATAWLTG